MYKIHEGSMSIKYQNTRRLILIYTNEISAFDPSKSPQRGDF